MTIIILLGFCYQQENLLSSSIQDLYRAYKEFSEYGTVYILTDMDIYNKFYLSIIRYNQESNNIERVLSHYQQYLCVNKQDLKRNLRNILQQHPLENILFYYTGHGKNNGILLPDNNIIPFISIRNELTRYLDINKQLIIICDCCQGTNWSLPYIFDYENKKISLNLVKDIVFSHHQILLFSSCQQHQESFSTYRDSLFTYFLIEHIKHMKTINIGPNFNISSKSLRRISDLMQKVQEKIDKRFLKQTIQVYASHPIDDYLFSWLHPNNDISFTINKRGNIFTFKNSLNL